MAQENQRQIADKANNKFIETTNNFFNDIGRIVKNGLKVAFDTNHPFRLDPNVVGDIIVNATQYIKYVSIHDIEHDNWFTEYKSQQPQNIIIKIQEIFYHYRREGSTEEMGTYVVIPIDKRNTNPSIKNKCHIDNLYNRLNVSLDNTNAKIVKCMHNDIIYIIGFYDENSTLFNYTSNTVDEVLPEHIITDPDRSGWGQSTSLASRVNASMRSVPEAIAVPMPYVVEQTEPEDDVDLS